MAALHPDADMAAQLDRTLIGAYVGAADIGEAVAAAGRVEAGDYEQWYREWSQIAEATATGADKALKATRPSIACRGYLRAAGYWRQSNFFLRQDLDDERVVIAYRQQRACFRSAIPRLPADVTAVEIPYEDTPIT